MPDNTLSINRENVPLWTGGTGQLSLNLGQLNPADPLPPGASSLFKLSVGLSGSEPIKIGDVGNVKLGLTAGTEASLTAIRPGQNGDLGALLKEHALDGYLAAHPGDLLLALRVGAHAGVSATGTFQYSVLSAAATVNAGGDAGYTYIAPAPATDSVGKLALDLFRGVRLPSDIAEALNPGQVIAFQYGGYLKVGVSLSAGYELKGTKDFTLGALDLSEHYRLSVLGKVGLNAGIAGNFAIEVRGTQRSGWVQVIVRRKRKSELSIAADVKVDFAGDLQGLPGTGREFLGAALGVNVKNWFNVLDKVGEFSDLNTLQSKLDGLANQFLGEWLDKAFGAIPEDFTAILKKVNTVLEKYNNLENHAISLFDRYFDKLDVLTVQLDKLEKLTSLDNIAGEVDGELWNVLRQLTGGDPLGFLLGRIPGPAGALVDSLPELKRRVKQTLDLIQGEAHKEIRDIIALAKESFPLDKFIRDLSQVDTIAELRALAGTKLGNFTERLIGKGIDALKNNSEAKEAVKAIQTFIEKEKDFEQRFNKVLQMAAKQRLSASLHAEYSRSDERRSLVDVEINLAVPRGRELLKAAGRGDFREILGSVHPNVVHLNEGVLSHTVTKRSAFAINIVGWHKNWNYSGFDKVVVDTEQRMKTDSTGAITVFTTLEMQKEKERKRNGERVYTNFLLRFLGESGSAVASSNKKNLEYLIDVIRSISAAYELSFTDERTEPEELADYLSFARDFGLDKAGATIEKLRPLLPMANNRDFGQVTAAYEVRFSEAGLDGLFRTGVNEQVVRSTMRKIVLANYLKKGGALADIAWCYATEEVHAFKKKRDIGAVSRFSEMSSLNMSKVESPIPGIDPPSGSISLSSNALVRLLNRLIEIENSFVKALVQLNTLIRSGEKLAPSDFESRMQDLGDALKSYDDVDEGDNTVFAVFDQLIRAQGRETLRRCSLTLTSEAAGTTVNKAFVLPVAEAASAAGTGL